MGTRSPTCMVDAEIMDVLGEAYDDDAQRVTRQTAGGVGFRWTGVMDAAHAAWIGGTRLLRYGELLPGGAARALEIMNSRSREDGLVSPQRLDQELVLELGMGRGRLALQLFLAGATVVGVELAAERYGMAVSALERLAHRRPDQFEISRRCAEAIRIRKIGGPRGALCEFRLGSFFDVVTTEEMAAATIVFAQVCLPSPVWPRVRAMFEHLQAGCRVLSYEDLEKVCEGSYGQWDCPFKLVDSPYLACSWAPEKGHAFHYYERTGRGTIVTHATRTQQRPEETVEVRGTEKAVEEDHPAQDSQETAKLPAEPVPERASVQVDRPAVATKPRAAAASGSAHGAAKAPGRRPPGGYGNGKFPPAPAASNGFLQPPPPPVTS